MALTTITPPHQGRLGYCSLCFRLSLELLNMFTDGVAHQLRSINFLSQKWAKEYTQYKSENTTE